jgi:hypothetical protein
VPAKRTVATGPSRIAAAHWMQGTSVVVSTRLRGCPAGIRASTLISACASIEPNTSPAGPL